jgi:hypothetical protein
MKIIKIDPKKFFKWLAAQPDERDVNMGVNCWRKGDDGCGCVMIQFAKENLPPANKMDAGYSNINLFTEEGHFYYDFGLIIWEFKIKPMKTMGQIKEHFAERIAALS